MQTCLWFWSLVCFNFKIKTPITHSSVSNAIQGTWDNPFKTGGYCVMLMCVRCLVVSAFILSCSIHRTSLPVSGISRDAITPEIMLVNRDLKKAELSPHFSSSHCTPSEKTCIITTIFPGEVTPCRAALAVWSLVLWLDNLDKVAVVVWVIFFTHFQSLSPLKLQLELREEIKPVSKSY